MTSAASSPSKSRHIDGTAARRSVAHNASARQFHDAVCHAGDLSVMCHDQDRGAGLRLVVEELQDLDPGPEVEFAGGFVGKQDPVSGGKRARDGHTLLLSPDSSWGKWRSRSPSPTVRASRPQVSPTRPRRPDRSAPNWTFSCAVRPAKRLKLWNTKLTVWRRIAKRWRADALSDIDAIQPNGAFGRSVECANEVQERRLAAPGRPQDDDELAVRNVQVDAVQRRHRGAAEPVALGDAAKADPWLTCCHNAPCHGPELTARGPSWMFTGERR